MDQRFASAPRLPVAEAGAGKSTLLASAIDETRRAVDADAKGTRVRVVAAQSSQMLKHVVGTLGSELKTHTHTHTNTHYKVVHCSTFQLFKTPNNTLH